MPPQSQSTVSPVRRAGGTQRLPPSGARASSGRYGTRNVRSQGELRMAYKAQSRNIGSPSQNKNIKTIDGDALPYNNGFFDSSNDHLSTDSAGNSVGTPSSVYMPSSVALSRDMSDLSGVSGDRHRSSSSHTIPGQIFDSRFLNKPWKQAYTLSNSPPECVNVGTRTTSSNATGKNRGRSDGNDKSEGNKNVKGTSIWVPQNDVVEIFDSLESSLGLDRFQSMGGKHSRIPIMVLLMNPPNQSYELMQIWVDRANDSIRDLVHVLQHKLPSQWKQAYDGLFQVRGHRFTQLINIIRLVKYDIQSHEILVAKPWAMTAKVTIAFAGSAIRHLTRVGVIAVDNNDSGSIRSGRYLRTQHKNEDVPLLLSKRARDRAYFPEGILNHHHALQFVTFSPSFEPTHNNNEAATTRRKAARNASAPNLSTSHDISIISETFDDPSSLLLGSGSFGQQSDSRLINSLIGGMSRRQKSSGSFSKRGGIRNNTTTSAKVASYRNLKASAALRQTQQQVNVHVPDADDGSDESGSDDDDTNCEKRLWKLNCFRKPSKVTKRNSIRTLTHETFPMLTSEEEEKRWLAYGMKPIVEARSLASGSIISMSEPLLLPEKKDNSMRSRQPFRPT